MYTISAINIVRDLLRAQLTDPYQLGGGDKRSGSTWIFGDEPVSGGKYPNIQIKKVDNPSEPINIGYDYTEFEQLYLNIWFYTKNGFKATSDSVEYGNSNLAEFYLSKIKDTLKQQIQNLHHNGVKGYKHMNTTTIEYDKDSQLYYGAVTIRVFYFNKAVLSTAPFDNFTTVVYDDENNTKIVYNEDSGRMEFWVGGVKKFEL